MIADKLQVGTITSTHGLNGELKVFPTTDDVKHFKKLKHVALMRNGNTFELEIERTKFFKNLVIVKFVGIDTLEAAVPYRGADIWIKREDAVALEKDEYFIVDLIGLDVLDEENTSIGKLVDVLQTGANDVYVIKLTSGKEILLPAIKDCILSVDIKRGVMKVHILEGLLDI